MKILTFFTPGLDGLACDVDGCENTGCGLGAVCATAGDFICGLDDCDAILAANILGGWCAIPGDTISFGGWTL